MDSDRFDDLSRQLARPRSRREALGLLGAAVVGLITGRSASAAPKGDKPSKCYGGGSSCTNAKQCCSGICTNRRCAPEIPPECTVAGDCPGADTECEVRTCIAGVCGTQDFVAGTDCSAGVCNGSGQCVECLTGADCESGLCENNACTPTCETNPLLDTPCTVGVGACFRSGVFVCTADGLGVECSVVAGQPSPEICDGIDNDCDGLVDEDVICPPLPNASSFCAGAGGCVLGSCNPGFGNCNGNPADGCETNLASNPNNCGLCGRVCPAGPNSSPICTQGICGIACSPGFGNCNGNPLDGCEANFSSDPANCGFCGRVCPPGAMCQAGSCCTPGGSFPIPGTSCCNGSDFLGLCRYG